MLRFKDDRADLSWLFPIEYWPLAVWSRIPRGHNVYHVRVIKVWGRQVLSISLGNSFSHANMGKRCAGTQI
jgi:hypothetical protein